MGLFSNSSPFDGDVEKATDENNASEDWAKIMDICDRVGQSSQSAKDCLESILKRLKHPDPHVVMQAAILLDACVNNCGKTFHLEVASRDFETEYKKLINKSDREISDKLKQLLQAWAEGDFKSDPELGLIPSLYHKLKKDGMDFPQPDSSKSPKAQLPKDPNAVASQRECDDIAKAIELSLKDIPTSPKSKQKAGPSGSSLYPSTSISTTPEGRKVRALYDFEAAEDNELTFKAGEMIHVMDDSDPNWWKGHNKRGEGLFPANFVTTDLSVEPEQPKADSKKTVQFNESVKVKKIAKDPVEIEINEGKMDRLLHYLHEADPRDASGDPQEMRELADEVNAMGPLIDTELERVDRKHAQLTQLSSDLVEALNLYHTLMREPSQPYVQKPPVPFGYMPTHSQHPPQPVSMAHPHSLPIQSQFNGTPANQPYVPPSYPMMPSSLPPIPNGPPGPPGGPLYMPDAMGQHPVNGAPYGPPGMLPHMTQPPPPQYHMQPGSMSNMSQGLPSSAPGPAAPPPHSHNHPSYHDKPPLL